MGEIEYGYHVAPAKQVLKVEAVREFVRRQLPRVLDIRKTTAEVYGDLKARLFEKHAWRHRKTKIRRPEELIDPVTSKELSIQENDLWMAAQAIERNLVFVAADKMNRIRNVAPELIIENWSV